MNRKEVIRMAHEAVNSDGYAFEEECDALDWLERFAALAVVHEREQCAKVAANTARADSTDYSDGFNQSAINIEEAIRARGTV